MDKQSSAEFFGEYQLNKRQISILEFIRSFIREKGYPPSVREIGKAVGLSSSASIHNHLQKLEAVGYIQRNPSKPRALEVLQDSSLRQQTMIPVPLVGCITAGQPILAEENIENTYPLPASLLGISGNEDVFMLTVSGESMIKAGIFDGDIILVHKQQSANNGDIVVAMIFEDEEATVKRFFKEKDKIRLQPENDTLKAMYYDDIEILGKVIGVFRFL